jgi:transposase
VRQGRQCLRAELPTILATRSDVLSASMLRMIEDLALDWRGLDERIDPLSEEIERLAHADVGAQRLMSVPGVGPIISSAMVAAIGKRSAGAWRHCFGGVLRKSSPPRRSSRYQGCCVT